MSKQTGPEFLRFFIPVVEVLRELGGSGRSAEVTDLVIDRMNIPEEEEAVILKSGQSRIYNQIAWARLYLVKAGLLDSSKRGVWSLTEKGRTAELTPDFALPALSEDCITLSGQKHEGFGQLDDFSWQTPFAGNR